MVTLRHFDVCVTWTTPSGRSQDCHMIIPAKDSDDAERQARLHAPTQVWLKHSAVRVEGASQSLQALAERRLLPSDLYTSSLYFS